VTEPKTHEPCTAGCTAAAQVHRLQAAQQRDVARTRVRRITVGTTTFAVAVAAIGAVALAAPHTTSSTAAATPAANAAGKLAAAGSSPISSGTGQQPVARTGGS
jgi:hypothetical protein